jgi:hypothetical protein
MLLQEQMIQSLAGLKGLASDVPKTVGWSAGGGPTVEVDFTAVDSLGCAFRELRLSAEELKNVPFDTLRSWADELCRKVTYLLEHIGPLEADVEVQTVLIRSTPPTRQPARTTFYEMLIKAPGTLNLRRYVRGTHADERQPCDMQTTHEVLVKLVSDIVAAIPAAAAES